MFSLSINRLSQARDQWTGLIRPLLGVLASAREPVGVPALCNSIGAEGNDVREGLLRLGGLVSQDANLRYQLFHLKFYDFLSAEPKDLRVPAVFDARDMAQWHHRIVKWCLPGTDALLAFWGEPVRDPVETERRSYALEHLVSHDFFANEWEYLCGNSWTTRNTAEQKLRSDPSGRTLGKGPRPGLPERFRVKQASSSSACSIFHACGNIR